MLLQESFMDEANDDLVDTDEATAKTLRYPDATQADSSARRKPDATILKNIRDHDLAFGIGPAGTGKPISLSPARSMRWTMNRSGASFWCDLRLRRASGLVSCPVICRRKSTPTYARCMTHFTT